MPTPPFHPAYRATVYAPRSVDATESTVLTPIGGAAHADPFVVTSIPGVTGARPYLDLPRGKLGWLDLLTKKVTVGALQLRLLDARTTPGGANAQRWATAFIGDAEGKHRLKGCKLLLEESLDGGGTWTAYFTGRIYDVALDGALWVAITGRSIAEDLKREVFTGTPHGSVAASSFRAGLLPYGLPYPWATLSATPWAVGTLHRLSVSPMPAPDAPARNALSGTITLTTQDVSRLLVTAAARPYIEGTAGPFRVLLRDPTTQAALGAFRVYRWVQPSGSTYLTQARFTAGGVQHWRLLSNLSTLWELPSGDPQYAAMPADGTPVEFCCVADGTIQPASKDSPLYIADVHPVQLWADILDGKYSLLNDDGSPRPLAARDTAAFAALIADASLGTVRFPIAATAKANEWIERNICQPFNLAYRIDGQGRVVPLDLRPSSTTTADGTIGDADLASATAPRWRVTGDGAVFAAQVTTYMDLPTPLANLLASQEEYPTAPPALVGEAKHDFLVVNPLASVRDAGDTVIKIDAPGLRLLQGEETSAASGGDAATDALPQKLAALTARMLDMLPPFAGGMATLPLSVRRSSAAGLSCQPGRYWAVTVTTQPDPATNTRGGTRLMLCTSRTENGDAVDLEMLDAGANAVAVGPAITSATISGTALTVAATTNAAGDPIRVDLAITPAGTAVRPADSAAAWTFVAPLLPASGSLQRQGLPARTRVWVRARSQVQGTGLKQPSGWVYPAGAGYVDVAGIPAPSTLVTSILANRIDLSWTVGDANQAVELFLATGGVPGTWTDAMRIDRLPPGTTARRIGDLAATTMYTVGVRHRDLAGGTSVMATVTFTTTSTAGVAPRPAGLDIATGGSAGTAGSATTSGTGTQTQPTGVPVAFFPGDQGYKYEIQRASDALGTGATTIASAVHGTTQVYIDPQPLDGVARYYRIRHVGYGDTASAWTGWIAGTPAQLPATLTRPAPIAPVVQETETATSTTGTVALTINDPQSRVTAVEFRPNPSSVTGAWAAASPSGATYTGAVTIGSPVSTLDWRVSAYDAGGTLRSGAAAFAQGSAVFSVQKPALRVDYLVIAGATPSTPIVRVTVQQSDGGTGRAVSIAFTGTNLVSVTAPGGGGSPYSGVTGTSYDFIATRRPPNSGPGSVQFTATDASGGGYVAATQTCPLGDLSVALRVDYTVVAGATPNAPIVRLTVQQSDGGTGRTVSIAFTGSNLTSVTAPGGGGSPYAGVTGTSYDFIATRKPANSGPGSVQVTATDTSGSGYLAGTTTVPLPDVSKTLAGALRANSVVDEQTIQVWLVLVTSDGLDATISYSITTSGNIGASASGSVTTSGGTATVAVNITRPVFRGGLGYVYASTTASGYVSGTASLEMTEQANAPAASVSAAIPNTGVPVVTFSGAQRDLSVRAAYSTASMPSDATAALATAQNLTGSRYTETSTGVTVAVGGTLFVKAIFYQGTGGTGTQGQIIEFQVARDDTTRTGRLTINGCAFQGDNASGAATYSLSKGAIFTPLGASLMAEAPLDRLPAGAIITRVWLVAHRQTTNSPIQLTMFRRGIGSTITDAIVLQFFLSATSAVTAWSQEDGGYGVLSFGPLDFANYLYSFQIDITADAGDAWPPGVNAVLVDYSLASLTLG